MALVSSKQEFRGGVFSQSCEKLRKFAGLTCKIAFSSLLHLWLGKKILVVVSENKSL